MELDSVEAPTKDIADTRNHGSYFEPIVPSDFDIQKDDDDDGSMNRVQLQRFALTSRESSATLASTPGAIEKQTSLQRIATGHPTLDPFSSQFDCRAWVRWFLAKQRQAGTKPKPHGLTFRNLTVSGHGPDVRYMQTILSTLVMPFRWWRMIKNSKSKTIISGINGSLRSGEMVFVLGRKGSGCSTLLKAISNELNGLCMEKDSIIHYSGILQQEMKSITEARPRTMKKPTNTSHT